MVQAKTSIWVIAMLLQLSCMAQPIAREKPYSFRESITLDAVILSLIQQVWDEPETYRGSGSNVPIEWHDTFRHLVEGDTRSLLANTEDSAMRAKLLNHISLRSASLLESLPPVEWELHSVTLPDLGSFRIIKDVTWGSEYETLTSDCLTVAAVAADHNKTWGETLSVAVDDVGSKVTPSHAIRLAKLQETMQWPRVLVAIAASSNGPFTLLDGNHRAVLLSTVDEDQAAAGVQVFVGVASNGIEETWKYWRCCPEPSRPF